MNVNSLIKQLEWALEGLMKDEDDTYEFKRDLGLGHYSDVIEEKDGGDIYTIQEWLEYVASVTSFMNGHIYPVVREDGLWLIDWNIKVDPYNLDGLPKDATHVVWYSKE